MELSVTIGTPLNDLLYNTSWEMLNALIERNLRVKYNQICFNSLAYRIDGDGLKKLENSIDEIFETEIEQISHKPTLRDLENMMAARGGKVHIVKRKK